MALDIREGDILTVGGNEYPIRSCSEWTHRPGSTVAMRRMCSVTAGTKRQPAIAAGKRGAPSANLSGVKCTPLDPADPDVVQRLALNTPHELLQTVADGDGTFYRLIVEDLKR